jgi:hypothetical protein
MRDRYARSARNASVACNSAARPYYTPQKAGKRIKQSRERPTRRDTRDRYDRDRSRSPSRNDDRDRRSYRDRDERLPNGHRDCGRYGSYSSHNNRPLRWYDDRTVSGTKELGQALDASNGSVSFP